MDIRRCSVEGCMKTCDCGATAYHWAYLHNDPQALSSDRGRPYSVDPHNYRAMCVPCHKAFDLARLAASA